VAKFVVELPLTFTVEIADGIEDAHAREAAVLEATRAFLASLSAKRIKNADHFWFRPAD
jgi:alpha/beta superfamily hydrolase